MRQPVFIPTLFLLLSGLLAAEEYRDPWLRPFSRESIWNTPIGANAVYLDAHLEPAHWVGVDREYLIRLSANDPVRDVYSPSSWGTRWPGDLLLGQMPVPDSLIIADASGSSTPNACSAFLMPDGKTVLQLQPTCRAVAGSHIVGWMAPEVDLFGEGTGGSHFGSGLSAIGGSIRLGELIGDEPIGHALKINVWADAYLYYSAQVPGYRWPADRADSYASTGYGGSYPHVVMGSLLAIPPWVTPESLDIQTGPGLKIFEALQDYGAYISDDSAWDAYDFPVENGVVDEVWQQEGIDISASSGSYVDDINAIVSVLHVVDNNAPATIGGGGVRRAPPPPPFAINGLPRHHPEIDRQLGYADISFQTEPGVTYQLRVSEDLEGWSDLGPPIEGDGEVAAYRDYESGGRRYWRVLAW